MRGLRRPKCSPLHAAGWGPDGLDVYQQARLAVAWIGAAGIGKLQIAIPCGSWRGGMRRAGNGASGREWRRSAFGARCGPRNTVRLSTFPVVIGKPPNRGPSICLVPGLHVSFPPYSHRLCHDFSRFPLLVRQLSQQLSCQIVASICSAGEPKACPATIL